MLINLSQFLFALPLNTYRVQRSKHEMTLGHQSFPGRHEDNMINVYTTISIAIIQDYTIINDNQMTKIYVTRPDCDPPATVIS